jgi:hypothetical protein
MNLAGETEVLGGNLSRTTLSTTKSHMTTRSRAPDRSGGKLATNRVTSDSTKTCQIDGVLSFISLLIVFSHRLQALLFYTIFTVITYFIFQFA